MERNLKRTSDATRLSDLQRLGPVPGQKLAQREGFPWPRFHFKSEAVILGDLIATGSFSNVRPRPWAP